MAKKPRLHEVSKVLDTSSKRLMAELSKKGFEFKTHMAALEGDAWEYIKKSYPGIESKLAELEKQKASAPKKKRKKKKKSSEMVTSRTKAAGKVEEKAPEDLTPKVEIVQERGGDTVEQKRIQGGIIRRRKVETPVEAPVETPVEAPAQESPIEDKPAATLSVEEAAPIEEVAEVETEQEAAPVEESPTEPAQTTPKVADTPAPEEKKAPGRNLSAPRKLKIVGQSTGPIPPQQPRVDRSKPKVAEASKPSSSPVPGTAEKKAADVKEAAGKKKAKNWTAPKVNKRQLLGMTEEVEISRPSGRRPKKQQRSEKKTQITTPSAQKRKIKMDTEITVSELADRMSMKAGDVVRALVKMGHMVSVHQVIDYDTAVLVAAEYGFEIENVTQTADDLVKADSFIDEEVATELVDRAPIVTIMGHVDHGKTSLLDYLRKARVAAGEAGGITQHIGAYQVLKNDRLITFLDTPGHEAFTKMRARGAEVTDVAIIVCAADEGPKPQTLEAIAHAKAANVPIIVALNKIDKPEANPDKVMQEMSSHELVPEEWGGDVMYIKVSAQTGEGIDTLLDAINLQAEILELKAGMGRAARGIVIESLLDKGKGPVATVLVLDGELTSGTSIVSGSTFGKVRAMFNDRGESISKAGPSEPVEVLGFNSVPEVGETVHAVSEESIARKASGLTSQARRAEELRKNQRISLEDMYERMKTGEVNELRVVLKGDVQGSVEAINDSLMKIEHDEVKVNIVYKAVGAVSESDVSLAAASGALVIGFNVRPTSQAKNAASQEGIQVKSYNVIYELIDDVKMAMQGLLAPEIKETVLGQAEVRNVFNLTKVGIIAGCYVTSGKIQRNSLARLIRDGVVVYDTPIQSLRRFKEDTREVAEGFECGIRLENYTDMKAGDVIECYEKTEVKRAVS